MRTQQDGCIPTGCGASKRSPAVCAAALTGLLALTMPLKAPAQGYERLPVMAEVANLAAGDHLNLREGPNAASPDLGDLWSGQRVEVVARSDAGDWSQVILPEGHGWVASRYLMAADRPLTPGGMPMNLHCSGTEPFWGLTIADEPAVKLVIMDGPALGVPLDWSGPSRNLGPGAYGFAAEALSGVLRRAECSDGMSDATYGWSLDVLLRQDAGQVLYSGCCAGR